MLGKCGRAASPVPGASTVPRLDVLLVPSSGIDATPRVIPEALSAGVPVICDRCGGIPELLSEGGGLLTPPADAAALAQTLCAVTGSAAPVKCSAPRRALSERRFTLTRYLEEIGSVLESAGARCSSTRRINSPAESATTAATPRTTR